MKLIACDALMGPPRMPLDGCRPDKADLLSEMARVSIESAIVRHRGALEFGPFDANKVILDELSDADNLLPSWFLTPDGFEPEFDIAKTVSEMIDAGVKICWTNPSAEAACFSILPWCSGPLYEALQAKQIPLLLDYETVTADELNTVLTDFGALRVILINADREGRNRRLYPLLKAHRNLYLCLSHSYSVHLGTEDLCQIFGIDRWVFGMGYPEAEVGAAVAGLMYTDIDDEAKEAIAYGNIERLLGEVK